MAKDPYKILGVAKTATDKEIQKAYRALAKKYHPDVNQGDEKAAERFKHISAAYSLLSDKNLRKQYDTGQVDGQGNQQNPFGGGGGFRNASMGGHPGGDMADLFSTLFGMNMGGAGRGPQTGHPFTRQRVQKGADVRYQLEISMPDAIVGVQKHIGLSGGKTLKVKIPAGSQDGSVLRLRGKGQPGVGGGPNGDAKITIKVKNHKYLRQDGNNLRMDLPITLKEAVLGAKIQVPTPHGTVSVNIAPGSSSGKTLRLKGKGVKGGDLLAKLLIIVPDDASDDVKTAIETLEMGDPRAKITF